MIFSSNASIVVTGAAKIVPAAPMLGTFSVATINASCHSQRKWVILFATQSGIAAATLRVFHCCVNDATTCLLSIMSQRTVSFSSGVFCSVTAMSWPGHVSMFGAITMPKLRAVMRLVARFE